MLQNYFRVAWRNLVRQLPFSIITILGLALSIACSLVIILYVHRELQYDRHIEGGDRVYRIATSFLNVGTFANGPEHLNERLLQYPEVEVATRIRTRGELLVQSETATFHEKNVYEVDSTFFQVFPLPFLAGDPSTCLNYPGSIVLSDKVAEKYFGSTDALGKTLLLGKEKEPMMVTGIVKTTDDPSHLNVKIWIPLLSRQTGNVTWFSAHVYNYVKLRPGFDKGHLENRLVELIKAEVYPVFNNGLSYEDWINTANAYKLYVQPLHDIYLHSKFRFELSPGGNEDNIYIFGGVAALILFLAMVNFVNLSTARAGTRAKEVGLRKTMGSSPAAMIGQFLTESVVTCLVALTLSLFLAELFLLMYQLVIGEPLLPGIFTNWMALAGALVFTCLLGVLAGLYPAFYLTSFQAAKVLKGNYLPKGKPVLRNVLVTFQFTISVCLVAFILIILKQLHYLHNKDLGFDKENLMVISNMDVLRGNKAAFRNELAQLQQVKSVCFTSNAPAGNAFWVSTYQTKEMQESLSLNTMPGDENMLETFGMKLIVGRNFDLRSDTDSTAAILNESAVKELGLNDDPIGVEINRGLKVIGVVSDFHFKGVQNKIEPLVIRYQKEGFQLALKLSGNINNFIEQAEASWKKFSPDEPFQYSFVDENFARLLKKERTFSKIIAFFSILAIIISCMGLLGLSMFMAAQRTKEIGIRKVLGASVQSVLFLLNKSYTRIILISMVIAVPVTVYLAEQWLSNFAYHITTGWDVFAITLVVVTLLTWLTVGGSSLSTALKNPVETLRYE